MAPKHGKKYLEALKKVDQSKLYAPADAIRLVKETSYTKFDASVEVHLRLGIDPRQADQNIRSTVALPHGTGKSVRVLVFAQGDAAQAARDAGADFVGADELITQIDRENFFDFDIAIATTDMMAKVGRVARKLGPRGLMPNPKSGTVTFDVTKAVNELKAGKIEFRVDKGANVHAPVGKASFSEDKLLDNAKAFLRELMRAKPSGAKGTYVRSMTISSTMGPGITLDPSAVTAEMA